MSDRFNGRIIIGGVLWKNADDGEDSLQLFLNAIRDQGIGQDWDGNTVSPRTEEELLTLVQDEVLDFTDGQAAYGHFEELETLCEDLNLSYDVYSDPHFEYHGEFIQYRPDGGAYSTEMNNNGNLVTGLKPVLKACEHLRKGQIHQALTLFAPIVEQHPEVSPLPPFEIKQRAEAQCAPDDTPEDQ